MAIFFVAQRDPAGLPGPVPMVYSLVMEKREKGMVSVVIPTYNRAKTIERALDSALAQDYGNKEILVVDDGSTDHTPHILARYKNQIRVLTQANKGVSAARNAAIKISRGEFVALLDSDDWWENTKLSCQVRFFENHPRAVICQTQEIWIRNGKRVNPRKKHEKLSGMIFEPSLELCLVSPSAVMIRAGVFKEKGLFKESFPVCEDYDLWLRITMDTPVHLIDRPLTVKTGGHKDQLSASHSQDRYRIASILDLLESGRLSRDQRRCAKRVLENKCQIFGNGCIKRGKHQEGAYYLALARQIRQT